METRLNEGCSLRICVPEGFPVEIQQKSRELIELYTLPDKRNAGFARDLLIRSVKRPILPEFPYLSTLSLMMDKMKVSAYNLFMPKWASWYFKQSQR